MIKHFWLCTCWCGMLLIFLLLLLPATTTTLLIEFCEYMRRERKRKIHIQTNIPVKQNEIPKTTSTCLIFTNVEEAKKCFVVYLDLNSMTNEFVWKFVTMFFVFFYIFAATEKINSMSRLHRTHLYLLIWSDTDFQSSVRQCEHCHMPRVCGAEWVSMIQYNHDTNFQIVFV